MYVQHLAQALAAITVTIIVINTTKLFIYIKDCKELNQNFKTKLQKL